MKLMVMVCALVLTSCVGVEAGGYRSRLEHSAGTTSNGVRLGLLTKPDPTTAIQGVVALEAEQGSGDFPPFRLDLERQTVQLGARRSWGPVYLEGGVAPQRLAFTATSGEHDRAVATALYGAVGLELGLGRGWAVGVRGEATTGARFNLLDSRGVDMDERSLGLTLRWSR